MQILVIFAAERGDYMPGTDEYLRQFGNVSFSERPFCDADNIALCEVFYMHLENVVSKSFDDEPMNFADACSRLFEFNGNKHKPVGLVINRAVSVKLMNMAKYPRFAEMKICACRHVYGEHPAVQFDCATFILPDGTNVVIFRGTDDTIAGWNEDLDIYTKKSIPSYKLSVDYLTELSEKRTGDIIICGHSKGGNVALYAGLNCSAEIADRIKLLFNNDGPGFHDLRPFATPAYRELLPKYRHIIPQSSFVGMLLAHDDDYTVIKSSRLMGLLQHDLATWQIKDGEIVTTKLTLLGKLNDRGLADLILRISDEQSETANAVAAALLGSSGSRDLTGLVKNGVASLRGINAAWRSLDNDTKEKFFAIWRGSLALLWSAAHAINKETAERLINSVAAGRNKLKQKAKQSA